MQTCRPIPTLRRLQSLRCRTLGRPRRRHATLSAAKDLEIYDVVCLGGGPAGLSLVNALRASRATSGLKVAIIDSQDLSKPVNRNQTFDEFSNRCSSLTPASVAFLREIGAWSHIDHSRVQPYASMNVWDGVSGSSIHFDWKSASGLAASSPSENNTIAYMTENTNLTSALLAQATSQGGISIFSSSRVDDIQLGTDPGVEEGLDLRSWPLIQLSNGPRLAARLLVGADGFNSPVRAFAGIRSRGWDYERHGVVATVRLEGAPLPDSAATAYQRFLPTGPAALLPLPGPFATLVWSTTPTYAAHLKSLGIEDMAAMIDAAFRLSAVDLAYLHTVPAGQVDEVAWREKHTAFDNALVPRKVIGVQPGSVASFPLRMRHADTYTGERVALVGDAAHTIHPLAGQGLNQGLADSQSLAGILADAVQTGQDIGSTLALEAYNAERWGANNMMLGVVDKLHKLYSVGSGPLVGLRSWGLTAVDALGPLKGFLMERAAGGR